MPNAVKMLPQLTESFKEGFPKKINQRGEDECWPWLLGKTKTGYGVVTIQKKNHRAHRVAYFIATGVDPGMLLVMHTCDRPSCCNPKHLELGTNKDNMSDMVKKGRSNAARGDDHYSRARPELVMRGSLNGSAKIDETAVRAILNDPRPLPAIAADYKVSKSQISRIKRRERWSHLTETSVS